jgi:hypothetical protein
MRLVADEDARVQAFYWLGAKAGHTSFPASKWLETGAGRIAEPLPPHPGPSNGLVVSWAGNGTPAP